MLSIDFVSSGAQIPFMLGLAIKRPLGYFVVPLTIVEVLRHITETNICALIISIISIAFLVTLKVRNYQHILCYYYTTVVLLPVAVRQLVLQTNMMMVRMMMMCRSYEEHPNSDAVTV